MISFKQFLSENKIEEDTAQDRLEGTDKLVKKYIKDTPYQKMYEESPANNVGSGNIAGANNDPPVKINNKIIKRKKLNDQNI